MLDDVERILIHEQTILSRLDEMARDITDFYAGEELTVVAVLNGSLIFAADLLRRIPLPLKLDCLSVSSYHGGTESSGVVTFDQNSMPDVRDRHVLVFAEHYRNLPFVGVLKHEVFERSMQAAATAAENAGTTP